jgi:H+/Cl- antiporter ClcA
MVLLVMVMVHVDWHFGRGHHHRLSMSWPYHWLTGIVTFLPLALFCAEKWPENLIRTMLINGAAGLVAGQIIEPLGEVVLYRIPSAIVFSPERWHVFWQFVLAGVVGGLAGVVIVWSRRLNLQKRPKSV